MTHGKNTCVEKTYFIRRHLKKKATVGPFSSGTFPLTKQSNKVTGLRKF